MNGLPPVNLADAFGAPRAKTDLGTLLHPKPTVTSTPPEPVEATPAPKRPRPARATTTTPTATRDQASHRRRGVIVYVTVQQREWIRRHTGAGRTTTDVVFDAIESHLDALRPEPDAPETSGLFTRSATPTTEPGVQLHLRLTPGNLTVLDDVVADKGFPSRSALIRAALQEAANT